MKNKELIKKGFKYCKVIGMEIYMWQKPVTGDILIHIDENYAKV